MTLHLHACPRELAAELHGLLTALIQGQAVPGAVCRKRNRARAVYELTLASGVRVFAKHDRSARLLDRLRFLRGRSRARDEFRNLQTVAALGVAVTPPLCYGHVQRWGATEHAVLVTTAVNGAENLFELWPTLGASERAEMLARLGQILRRLHDSGLWHRDLNAGNVLVVDGAPVLVDLQKARKQLALTHRQRTNDLALLADDLARIADPQAAMAAALPDDDLAALLGAYGEKTATAAAIRSAVAIRRAKQLRSRSKRCVVASSGFRQERSDGNYVYRRADVPSATVSSCLRAHSRALTGDEQGCVVVKDDLATRVTRVADQLGGPAGGPVTSLYRRGYGAQEPAGAGDDIAVKEFPSRGLLRALSNLVRRHRGMVAWRSAHALLLRNIETPCPLALVEQRRFGLVWGSWLLSRWEPDTVVASDMIVRSFAANGVPCTQPLRPASESVCVRHFAQFVATLHGHGLYHGDLKPLNVLVHAFTERGEPRFRFLLLDLDALHVGRRLTWRRRVKNLAQIADFVASFLPQVKRTHFVRFVRSYLAASVFRRDVRRRLYHDVADQIGVRRGLRAGRGERAIDRRQARGGS